ncbi:MAG TPA: hypothetical protein VF292_05135 [Rhodanobacteraceae bacterium]
MAAVANTSGAWAFRRTLRRSAFGWRGTRLAITRLKEALAEIRTVARRDPARAAEGAVLLLEKVSPAVCNIDSSSGALGSAVQAVVAELVPIIAAAKVSDAVRDAWLRRLFDAIQDDDPPYIESLGDAWGELCVTAERASRWVDELLPTVRRVIADGKAGRFGWFPGTGACYSALFKAGRHDELLDLIAADSPTIWQFQVWGARVYAARGEADTAIAYMDRFRDRQPEAFAAFAEELLLGAGRRSEAYAQYAIAANQRNSYLATYRAIAKRYPEIEPDKLLDDLIASTPGEEGKWFATARALKLFDRALALACRSPTEPKTLIRAASAEIAARPQFACDAGLLALHWIALGYGYEITGADINDAVKVIRQAGVQLGRPDEVEAMIDAIAVRCPGDLGEWMRRKHRGQ